LYQIENVRQILRAPLTGGVSRTVLLLGLTSLFTDVSSEMVATVLPLYLLFDLALTPVVFGVIDGLYLGAAALVRVFGGVAADRWGRHKEVAVAGYSLSAVTRIGLLVVGSAWALLAGVVLVDRLGKGIRTAPRDAILSTAERLDEEKILGIIFNGEVHARERFRRYQYSRYKYSRAKKSYQSRRSPEREST